MGGYDETTLRKAIEAAKGGNQTWSQYQQQTGQDRDSLLQGAAQAAYNTLTGGATTGVNMAGAGGGANTTQATPNTGVPDAPEVAPTTDESDNSADATNAELGLKNLLIPSFQQPQGPVVQDAGEDYASLGGPGGKAAFNKAFVEQPQAIASAIEQGAQAQQEEAKAKTEAIAKEQERVSSANAVIKERQLARQQEIQARDQDIQRKVQFYTNDLADTGKFWRNPGNIVAAMGAALMTLASDDHAIGYKLINNAIQQDLAQRQKLADMHLGELRSNLGAYRQIAGDEFQGDLLAEAEAKRVAAMELERIGAQYSGPKAKAAAAAIQQKLLSDYQQMMMQWYATRVYQQAQIINPALKAAHEREGKALPGVGFQTFGQMQQASAVPGSPGAPMPQGAGGAASSAPAGVSLRQPNQGGAPAQGVVRPSQALLDFVGKRVPHVGQVLGPLVQDAIRDATIESKAPYGDPRNTAVLLKNWNDAQKEVAAKTDKNLQEAYREKKGWQNFANTLAIVQQSAIDSGMTPDQLYNSVIRDATPESWSRWYNAMKEKYGSADTPAAKQAMERMKAMENLRNTLQSKKIGAFHSMFGGAMNEHEMEMAKGWIDSNAPFSRIIKLADDQGRAAEAMTTPYGLSPWAKIILENRVGQRYPMSNTAGTGAPMKTEPKARPQRVPGPYADHFGP